MSSPGTVQFPALSATPSAPPVGSYLLYIKTDNTIYLEDSAGNTYAFGSTDGITALTGDVTATGPGSAVATVAFVGGQPAADVAGATVIVDAATSSNTPSTLVLRDSSGNFIANIITATLSGNASTATLATNTSNVGSQTATDVANATITVDAATSTNTASTLVERDASGNFSANVITASLSGNATTSTSFTGSLSGDVTGGQSSTAIASTVVTGKVLTGYSAGSNTAIAATDSILGAFEKVQGQLNAASGAAITALTGDGTATGPGSVPFTLATVNSNVGSFGSSTAIPSFTVNAKGLVTAASTNVVVAPAGTLTGTTLASNVVTSSLTSVGTITSGTWNGTTIAIANGGTGQVTANAGFDALSPMTTTGDMIYEDSTPTAVRLPVGSSGNILTVSGGVPTWAPPATSGTVTSVGLADTSTSPIYTVTNTPVTSSGAIDITLNTQSANTVFAGPSSGSAAQPTFRSIVSSDVPTLNQNTTGTAANITATSNSTLTTLSALSLPASQITGSITAAQMLALPSADIYVGNVSNQPAAVALSGDATLSNTGALTLSTVNASPGSTTLSSITTNGKGLVTSNSSASTTGSGNVVLATSPTLITPNLGTPSTLVGTNITGTASGLTAGNINATSNSTLTSLPNLAVTGSQVGGFTQGSIIFAGASGTLTQDNSNFYWDDTNHVLGIGIIPATSVMIDGLNTGGSSKLVQMTGYGVGSTTGYRGRFARGTLGSPTAAQTGDILNAISGRGYGASQFAAASTGVINVVAAETFTNTSNATYLQFSVTPIASVTAVEHMRVAATGVTLGPQSSSTDLHTINGGRIRTTKTITSSYSVDATTTDDIILCNQSGAITITLPTPTVGRTIVIKDISGNAETNTITVAPHSSENIEGLTASKPLNTNYGSWTFSVGSAGNWWMI